MQCCASLHHLAAGFDINSSDNASMLEHGLDVGGLGRRLLARSLGIICKSRFVSSVEWRLSREGEEKFLNRKIVSVSTLHLAAMGSSLETHVVCGGWRLRSGYTVLRAFGPSYVRSLSLTLKMNRVHGGLMMLQRFQLVEECQI